MTIILTRVIFLKYWVFRLRWRKQHFKFLTHLPHFNFIACIVPQSLTECSSYISEQGLGVMTIFIKSTCRSTEWTLKCEWVYQIELLPHHYPSCGFSGLLHHKVAIIEREIFCVFMEEHWEYSFFQSVLFHIGTTIHKGIFQSWMAMVVTVKE